MSAFSEIEQRTSDLDWYAVDAAGHLGQFLTGGALLPFAIAEDRESFELLARYFNSLAAIGESVFCPGFAKNCPHRHVSDDPGELMPFGREMSRRGLYSYDKNNVGASYYRVTLPVRELHLIDLPGEIAAVLSRNQLVGVHFDKDMWVEDSNLLRL